MAAGGQRESKFQRRHGRGQSRQGWAHRRHAEAAGHQKAFETENKGAGAAQECILKKQTQSNDRRADLGEAGQR